MATTENPAIILTTTTHLPVDKVWSFLTLPGHIMCWNNASEDRYTPWAENDLRVWGKFVSIGHTGIVWQGREITSGEEYEKWAGALENHAFTETNGITSVTVSTDAAPEFADYFALTWPKALARLQEICKNDDVLKNDECQYYQ